MNIRYEEHAAPQRAGGIEAAICGLIASLVKEGGVVTQFHGCGALRRIFARGLDHCSQRDCAALLTAGRN